MDTNEILALLIVAAAVVLLAVHFFRKKGGGGCGADCLKAPGKGPTNRKEK